MKDISEIPKGFYCYDANGVCPYWNINPEHGEQDNGYCSYLGEGDWDSDGMGLLWDKVKLCDVNKYTDEELLGGEILGGESDICNLIQDIIKDMTKIN